ncbi:B12-binding domain-containing protein, partial [Chloroflexota bacterium]
IVSEKVKSGESAISLIEELRVGMDLVGQRYKSGDYFLAELVYSSVIFNQAMTLIEPSLRDGAKMEPLGKIVIGTVKGDIHNLGKDIVSSLLRASGFEVHDLGVDVEPKRFVQGLEETRAPIVGLSCLITVGFEPLKATVQAVIEAGLRDKVKIIIGGGVVTEFLRDYVRADAHTTSAFEGVEICKRFVREGR